MTRKEEGGGATSAPFLRFSGSRSGAAAFLVLSLFLSPACRPAVAPPRPAAPRATAPVAAPRPAGEDERLLDLVERRSFDYFWDLTNPANGLVPDRWPTPSFSSVAAVGFGLTAYPIGVERGYVTREAARERRRARAAEWAAWTDAELLAPVADPAYVAELRIFNPDGSEAELSGNGARQAILYLRRAGWTDARQ